MIQEDIWEISDTYDVTEEVIERIYDWMQGNGFYYSSAAELAEAAMMEFDTYTDEYGEELFYILADYHWEND